MVQEKKQDGSNLTIRNVTPYIAPYIGFPWNTNRALIGKPISIYKVDDGYFVSVKSNEFKPIDQQKIESNITKLKNTEFKPIEIENNRTHTSKQSGKYGPEGI